MVALVNKCIIRRTNALLSKYLPPKIEQVVVCRRTSLQSELYQAFTKSKAVKKTMSQGNAFSSLSAITTVSSGGKF